MKLLVKITLFLCLILSIISTSNAKTCQTDNEYLQAMPDNDLTINSAHDQPLELGARMAVNDVSRAAGFQWVCESVIEKKPILFVFDEPGIPQFHMRNVVAPIDIAFIDSEGRIESIQSMQPYVLISKHRPLYSPARKVIAALEAHKGFYQKHGIEVGALVDWGSLK